MAETRGGGARGKTYGVGVGTLFDSIWHHHIIRSLHHMACPRYLDRGACMVLHLYAYHPCSAVASYMIWPVGTPTDIVEGHRTVGVRGVCMEGRGV